MSCYLLGSVCYIAFAWRGADSDIRKKHNTEWWDTLTYSIFSCQYNRQRIKHHQIILLLAGVQEMPGLNLSQGTDYPVCSISGFPSPLQVCARIVPWNRPLLLHPQSFHFQRCDYVRQKKLVYRQIVWSSSRCEENGNELKPAIAQDNDRHVKYVTTFTWLASEAGNLKKKVLISTCWTSQFWTVVSSSLLVVQNCHTGFEIYLVRDVIVVGCPQPLHLMWTTLSTINSLIWHTPQ